MRRYAATASPSVSLACLATVATAQPKSSNSAAKMGIVRTGSGREGRWSVELYPVATSSRRRRSRPAGPARGANPEAARWTGRPTRSACVTSSSDVDLKDQIRRSHTVSRSSRLRSFPAAPRAASRGRLQERDVERVPPDACALFVVDGGSSTTAKDDSGASRIEKIPIFNGSMPPGDHTVQSPELPGQRLVRRLSRTSRGFKFEGEERALVHGRRGEDPLTSWRRRSRRVA